MLNKFNTDNKQNQQNLLQDQQMNDEETQRPNN